MTLPLKVSGLQARAFLRRAHLIDTRAADIGAALAHHGYIQIDPINICGRMHDHILRNRVRDYREGGLMRHLHFAESGKWLGPHERRAFEHHFPSSGNLVAFPLEAWPHLHGVMRSRTRTTSSWSGRLTPREKEFSGRILERFAHSGVLGPDAFADDRKGRGVWGAATLAKSTLQKLFFHGRLLIVGREHNRRLYDLPKRVLPPAILRLPEASPSETERWMILSRLRQHRLMSLKRGEWPRVEDQVVPVTVEGGPLVYCFKSDLAWFEPSEETYPPDLLLLAPLDPMIYDRKLTRLLWGFDYTWEAYTPAPKRKRGYYALPVLSGLELVGHVDLRADRKNGRLVLASKSVRRGYKTAPAVGRLARFLNLKP